MRRKRSGRRFGVMAMLCALVGSGCAGGHHCCFPQIDPTGDHIFVHGNSTPPPPLPVIVGPPMPPGTAPVITPPVVTPATPPAGLATIPPVIPPGGAVVAPPQGVAPAQVVAQVGSEVLVIATVVNQKGSPLPGERVEWSIAQGGVGQFVSPGKRGSLDFLDAMRGLPQKVSNTYVVNSTVTFDTAINRETPTPADDVPIRSGQAWVTVTSPVEGNTVVVAHAPAVKGWEQGQQTTAIYWIDCKQAFPPPAVAPAGSRQSFTTTLSRQTDGAPLAGWIVRYEIAGGPDAGFSPDGTAAIDAISGETGQATAEIFQKSAAPGSNPINIQVMRPAGPGGPGQQVVIASGSTTATWTASDLTASDLTLRTTGPAQATVGAVATYRIEVTNPAPAAIHGVVVTDQAPPGLTFLNSNPAATSSAGGQEWQIGDLSAQQSQVIEVNFRVEQVGSLSYCATVSADSGLTAKGCATTVVAAGSAIPGAAAPGSNGAGGSVAGGSVIPGGGADAGVAPSQFDIAIKGPAAAEVGTDASFTIEVTNRGAAATGVVISDRFDAGFQHAAAASPIAANLDQIGAGEKRRIEVTFHVVQAGQLCQEVTVTADGGLRDEARSCITAADRAGVAAPPGTAPIIGGTTPQQARPLPGGPTPANPIPANPPPANPPPDIRPATPKSVPATGSRLSVRMKGPDRRKLGDEAQFVITVTNAGDTPLKNVFISDVPESSLEVRGAETGFVVKNGVLTWTIESLGPGETKSFRVDCRCAKESTQAFNRVHVTADGGTTGADEAAVEIVSPAAAPAAPAVAASKMSIAVADNADPIRPGGETLYQIVLTNSGAGPAKRVVLSVTVSPEMTITDVPNPPVLGNLFPRSVRFTPIAEVRAGESITFDIRVRGDRAGTGKLHAEMTSDRDKTPIVADESTQILN